MIKRSHIRQFLAVVETGSFTQAAARIRVTQPTLSAGIAELERQVGTRLFVRNRRRIRMTEAGGKFLPIARELERNFLAADNFGEARAGNWPDIRLGVLNTIAAPLLERIVAHFAARFSLELVEGNESELDGALANGRIDAALTLLHGADDPASAFPLLTEPYAMLVRAGHPLLARGTVRPDELASETMIARRNCELLDETSRFFTRHRVRPRFALRSSDDTRCIAMVAAGIAITTAPLSFARDGVTPLPIEGYDYSRTLGLRLGSRWLDGDERRGQVAALAGDLRADLAA